VRRHGRTHPLGKSVFRTDPEQARAGGRGHAYGEIHQCDRRPAPIADFVVDRFLSQELCSILGICVLLLNDQLLNGRFGRSLSPAHVADLGGSGKHHCVLMCGLSASFLVAFMVRLIEREGVFVVERGRPSISGRAGDSLELHVR